jgi:hypothetical protein
MANNVKVIVVALILALASTASAQSTTLTPVEILKPSPLSLVMIVGRWVMTPEQEKVYKITVQGRGRTESQAKSEAFKLAVEQAVGSLILTESVVINQDVARREIIEYSSGYVHRYEEVLRFRQDNELVIQYDIWVKRSRIADRLLVEAKSTKDLDGSTLQSQLDSIKYERHQGQRVLESVLNDYPHRAYDVKNQRMKVGHNSNYHSVVGITFDLDLSPIYLRSLWEAMQSTSQNPQAGACRANCYHDFTVTMHGRRDQVLFNRWQQSFGFNDAGKQQLFYNKMMESRPSILVKVLDAAGHTIEKKCYFYSELDGVVTHTYPKYRFVTFNNHSATIDGTFTLTGKLELNIPNINRVRTVDLSVIQASQCPR